MSPRLSRPLAPGRYTQARPLIVAGGLIVGIALAVAVTLMLTQLRMSAIANGVRELNDLALVLSEEADRSLQATESTQVSVIDHIRMRSIETPEELTVLADGFEFHQYLRERVAGLPMIGAIAVLDMHGRLVNSSLVWPASPVDLSDRDYAKALVADHAPPTYIGTPVQDEVNGSWSIVVARKVTSASGRFLGIVSSTFELGYFEHLFSRLSLNASSSFALYHRDGMLLARYPHADPSIGRSFLSNDGFHQLIAVIDHGALRRLSMVDGVYRLIVPHSLPHYPLLVSVTSSFQSILSHWQGDVQLYGISTILLEIVIAGLVILGVRQVGGRERLQAAEAAKIKAQAELALAEEQDKAGRALQTQWQHFEMALENMHQGLCMYNNEDRILVSNHRFAQIFNLPYGVVAPGTDYAKVIDVIVAAGLVSAEDMQDMREYRRTMVDRRAAATFNWLLTNGRTLTVTHQPMNDGWLTTYEDVTERYEAEARITHMAQHDVLTGLPNRFLFRQRLEEALTFARRGRPLAVLCLDLDQFKAVNDTLGHPIGDSLLRAVAARLDHETRETDTVARLGGDEFAIVQKAADKPAEAAAFAQRIIDLLEQPFEIEGHHIVISTSIGIAFAPQDDVDGDGLMRCADLALYRAKADGRGVCRLFQAEMDAEMQARRTLELDLHQALQAGQFELFYQPLIDVRRRTPTGFEALLRWRHPERGIVPPADFIPLAEEVGLITAIGEWVLHRACNEAVSWPGTLKVAVNLSPAQFRSRNLVNAVVRALQGSGLPADRLELEITETVLLQDTEATLAVLRELRALGVHIAMDDFGTGYSSLSYLRCFVFDRIKVDQSFVRELGKRHDCSAIVRAVATLSSELGMATTAEGVETEEQLSALTEVGCSEVQGYLFSPAVPASDVSDLLVRLTTFHAAKTQDINAESEMSPA
jgi:diguanylate cyclase (GGDEF)-like protein